MIYYYYIKEGRNNIKKSIEKNDHIKTSDDCLPNKSNNDQSYSPILNKGKSRQSEIYFIKQQQQENQQNLEKQLVITSKSYNLEEPVKTQLDTNCNSEKQNLEFIKNLLFQMSSALRLQHQDIENLKKHQITSQLQFKSQIDSTLKQLFVNQQQLLQQQQHQLAVMHQELMSFLNKELLEADSKLIQAVCDEVIKLREKIMDPLRNQLSRDLTEQLKNMDGSFKEQISKLFKSKSTLDVIGQSVTQAVQPTVVNTYRETFQKIIVPNFEKSCQIMYQQVNASFAKGTHVLKNLYYSFLKL